MYMTCLQTSPCVNTASPRPYFTMVFATPAESRNTCALNTRRAFTAPLIGVPIFLLAFMCSWPERAFVRDSCFFGGRTTIVSFLLLPGDFAARRFLRVEARGPNLRFPCEVSERRIGHDQPECVAVRRRSVERHDVPGISPLRHRRTGFNFDARGDSRGSPRGAREACAIYRGDRVDHVGVGQPFGPFVVVVDDDSE